MSESYDMPDADPDTELKAGSLWVEVDPATSPVIPLGFYGGKVVFALPEGELREEPAAKIPAMLKTDLYVSKAGRQFLIHWRDSEGRFQRDFAAQWFVNACREAGRWDDNRPKRGYGVWPSAEGPIVHAGDAVGRAPFRKDDWKPVATALRETGSGPIWLLRPPVPRPGKPATVADGETLRGHLDRWAFAPMGSGGLSEADVLMGWQGVALLGGVPSFRPHISVSGGAGTGKTTLSRLMQAAGSANAGELLDTFTEAGIKNSLTGEARGLYMDEAEPSPDGQGPVERVMEVLRRMSTGDGSSGRKGDVGGRTVATTAVGCAYLASIFPVALGDAMATRMVEVRLRPLGKAKGGADGDLSAAIDWAREASPALLARAVRLADRFKADAGMLKTALGEGGSLPRAADLIAALAAGRRLLLSDEALSLEGARDEVRLWSALIQGREETSSAQNPGQGCISRIWAMNSGQHVKDRHLTIGEMIEEEATSPGYHDKVLKTFGLIVENGHANAERPGPWLLISTNHPALVKGLAGTQYANWRGVLEHLADLGDAYAPRHLPTAKRFGLHQSRAIAVPLTPWLGKPVAVGVDPRAASPFDEPDWDARFGPASRPASHEESHD
ncbi:hypothetical protein [Brevundimonas subvibrioides]|uniref:Uncharacterized protein n=1 Tax=Brevundimonas subvibrioides (strain ATCC 15264 / DSM 4735 / LMG 14903 / NBRC 16000 / CB 81) TaxID=633149 RepID=D9QFX2_BRESC|nr:hypothetical protein [Brevundimonas subvibrioides]ADL00686.1 hypothetical protein Bresu_1374 [Brevundimonas subvibrioides ATCC 15264]